MCAYCGEDVPAGSANCWKCGLELDGDTADAASSELGDLEQRPKAARRPQRDCPHCGEPVAVRAIRCNACGEQLSSGGRRNWVTAAWAAFGVVLLSTVIGVIYSRVSGYEVPPDPGRATPLKISRAQLSQLYKSQSKHGDEKKRGLWDERHKDRFVVWESYLLKIEEDYSLSLGDSSRGDPDVHVILKDSDQIEARDLKVGKWIRYSARLVDYDSQGQITLDLGVVED